MADALGPHAADGGRPHHLERLTGPGGPFALRPWPEGGGGLQYATPGHLLDIYTRAARRPERPLLVGDGEAVSFQGVLRRAAAIAGAVLPRVEQLEGARIALAARDGPDWIAGFVAITGLGASAVLIDPGDPERALEAMSAAECRLAIAEPRDAAWLSGHAPCAVLALGTLPEAGGAFPWRVPSPDDEALVAFTSGSTGRPKGVVATHRNLVNGLQNMLLGGVLASQRRAGLTPPSLAPPAPPVVLVGSPLRHIGGYGQVLMTLMTGGALTLGAGAGAPDLLRRIVRARVTSVAGAPPALVQALIDHGADAPLRSLSVHGRGLDAATVGALQAALPNLAVGMGYGMSETCGAIASGVDVDWRTRPGTCGLVAPAAQLRIVDAEGAAMGPGAAGEIQVRGPMVAGRLGGGPPAEWLRTGDFGSVDAAGFLHVLDRMSNIVATPAGPVSCAEIERVACAHPGVLDAAAVPLRDAGTPAFALGVVARPEASLADLAACLRGDGAPAADIRVVRIERAPRTPSGKIDRVAAARLLGA